uniref:GATA-type domain-containing protein n=2 Tax=Caenorhabditis japonica TaxID=281687 RepID=A0A8R1HM31_CAEJA
MENYFSDSPFFTPLYAYSAFPYWENYYDYSNAYLQNWNFMAATNNVAMSEGFIDTSHPQNPSLDASLFWSSPTFTTMTSSPASTFSESSASTQDFSSFNMENSPQNRKHQESCSKKSENSKNQRCCTNCQTTKTCRWRNVTTRVLCNACFVYTRKYHKPRPSTAVIAYHSRVQSDGKMKHSQKSNNYNAPY